MVGTVALAGTGIRHDGLDLIPCFSQTTTFLEECLQHCRARPVLATRLVQPLVELTAAVTRSETPSHAAVTVTTMRPLTSKRNHARCSGKENS